MPVASLMRFCAEVIAPVLTDFFLGWAA